MWRNFAKPGHALRSVVCKKEKNIEQKRKRQGNTQIKFGK